MTEIYLKYNNVLPPSQTMTYLSQQPAMNIALGLQYSTPLLECLMLNHFVSKRIPRKR